MNNNLQQSEGRQTLRPLAPFGVWLREQARMHGMSQAELARRAGLSKCTLSVSAYGKPLCVQSCRALAHVLDLPVSRVLEAAGHLDPDEQLVEIPTELWDLVCDLRTVDADVRRTVIETWRAALELARGGAAIHE